jgi:thiosulfate/3-mercaptopyruvate sulfurtransferase
MAADSPFTVDADWLQQRLGEPGLTIVDASWYLPAHKRDARTEYDAAHIPGAVFFDQDAVSDPDSELPHTLPSPRHFARFVGTLGISADDTIVVYDGPDHGRVSGLCAGRRLRQLEGGRAAHDIGSDEDRALHLPRRVR